MQVYWHWIWYIIIAIDSFQFKTFSFGMHGILSFIYSFISGEGQFQFINKLKKNYLLPPWSLLQYEKTACHDRILWTMIIQFPFLFIHFASFHHHKTPPNSMGTSKEEQKTTPKIPPFLHTSLFTTFLQLRMWKWKSNQTKTKKSHIFPGNSVVDKNEYIAYYMHRIQTNSIRPLV